MKTDNTKNDSACGCGCGGNCSGKPWGSIVIIALCAIWIIARLAYFFGSGNKENASAKTDAVTDSALASASSVQGNDSATVRISGLLASDFEAFKTMDTSSPAFSNAFVRLQGRRKELAAQQTALEFDYRNWLNSWAATNRTAQTKIARLRALSRKDQSDPEVAAKTAKVAASLRKIVGADPVGSALLARCESLLPETEAVEKLYIECVKALGEGKVPSSPAAAREPPISALKAGPASEPVSFQPPAEKSAAE